MDDQKKLVSETEFEAEIADEDAIRAIDSAIEDIERSETNIRRVKQEMQRPVIQVACAPIVMRKRRFWRF